MDHVVQVPGARLRVRELGAGPLLLLLGGTADGGALGVLAQRLAESFTVLTYDRRGLGNSVADDPDAPVEVAADADDAAAVLTALSSAPALVAATSNGAIQGLELAIRHPDQLQLLLAHEPPLPSLLPDHERTLVGQAQTRIDQLVRAGQPGEAAAALAQLTGPRGAQPRTPDAAPSQDKTAPARNEAPTTAHTSSESTDTDRAAFFTRIVLPLHRYRPDPTALATCPVHIIVGAGQDHPELVGPRSAAALARLRGTKVTPFPGGHAGFIEHPDHFTARLVEALHTATADDQAQH